MFITQLAEAGLAELSRHRARALGIHGDGREPFIAGANSAHAAPAMANCRRQWLAGQNNLRNKPALKER
jgi:hypothetical protein